MKPPDVGACADNILRRCATLGFGLGLSRADIFAHVLDSISNQCLKASQKSGQTIWPSSLRSLDVKEVAEEAADVVLTLKDVLHVAKVAERLDEVLGMESPPTIRRVGGFIDGVAGTIRTPGAVAGRMIEEATELTLASGRSPAEILMVIGDMGELLHLQTRASRIGFDSRMIVGLCYGLAAALGSELADVQTIKFDAFTRKRFRVAPSGCVYTIKPHVMDRHMAVVAMS